MANSQLLGLQKESTSPQPRTYVPIAPPIKAPTIPIIDSYKPASRIFTRMDSFCNGSGNKSEDNPS